MIDDHVGQLSLEMSSISESGPDIANSMFPLAWEASNSFPYDEEILQPVVDDTKNTSEYNFK